MLKKILFLTLFIGSLNFLVKAQSASQEFDVQEYLNFLTVNDNLDLEGIKRLYPSDSFLASSPVSFSEALYSDSVNHFFQFNEEEIALLEEHGFMVSDRIRYKSFGEALMTAYKRDLPVYISSDAILHAVHMSYSNLLSTIESQAMLPKLIELLSDLQNQIPILNNKYAETPELAQNLNDIDIYLTVPLLLLEQPVTTIFEENQGEVDSLVTLIEAFEASPYPLFSDIDIKRDIDFSQFTPRGHYAGNQELTKYFKAMMWLGRTEMYLKVPEAYPYTSLSQEKRDSIGQRQTIDSFLIEEALAQSIEAQKNLEQMDELIDFLVGESDNVSIDQLSYLKEKVGFEDAGSLTNTETYKALIESLEEEPFSGQKILSQILVQDPTSPNGIVPASAFLLFGQRFIIDSYILGNVVFDKIDNNVRRMLPKSADVLFALGNDDALDVLETDLQIYGYSRNLAALRYLIDSYPEEYWETTFFNLWLNSIRTLNPPKDRAEFPEFTQTEAWSKKTMTTQLASWAELRHDNLLYAKQSYTGGPICKFPYSYVEPNPDFFEAIHRLATVSKSAFERIDIVSSDYDFKTGLINYFSNVAEVSKTLKIIAQKELDGTEFSLEEEHFLKSMLHEDFTGCATEITGWYKDLYLNGEAGLLKEDFIVADVHTSPFDQEGKVVGWVMHAGTGPVNLATLVTELPDGNSYTFIGPVMSYYEHVSINFKRLTDQEWVQTFEEMGMRPEFTDSYLSTSGEPYYDNRYLIISGNETLPDVPQTIELSQNYPNPFNAGTLIGFKIPVSLNNQLALLEIYNVQGQHVETLINQRMTSGNYSVRWTPNAASGTYFYRLKVGEEELVNRMLFIK